LSVLVERAGEIVTREELRAKLWPGDTFVDFDHSLNSAVARLRETLCDSAEKPRFIETIAKRGYRFIAPLQTPTPTIAVSSFSPAAQKKPFFRSRIPRKIWMATSVCLVLFPGRPGN
jgi:DNA-binding winged helix-turn-helix (wHTH) protein